MLAWYYITINGIIRPAWAQISALDVCAMKYITVSENVEQIQNRIKINKKCLNE